jgi:hypothetical protein
LFPNYSFIKTDIVKINKENNGKIEVKHE